MNTTIHRDADRVWLEDVSGWSIGDRESSVHAAQAAAMAAVGEHISYEYLVGVSGLAFRMQVSKDGLCPSSPHSFCGYPCHARSSQALPWTLQLFEVKPDEGEKVEAARQAIVASIDRGVPVQYGSEEDGIIVGYQESGQEWICFHPLRDGGTKTFVETSWPWGILLFAESKPELPSKRQLAIGALQQALEMATAKEADNYHVGWAAWEAYVARLRTLQQADEETRQGDQMGNSWIYECLSQYRVAAAAYLREIAGEFDDQASGHLLQAAGLYEQMAKQVLQDDDHCLLDVAPPPWHLRDGQAWTNEMRQAQIERLEAALPLERLALQQIERALETIGL